MNIRFYGGTRFEVESRGHLITTDQSVEDGGLDAGMTPVELFVASLASCVGYFVSRYGIRHAIAVDGLTIDASWSYAEQPHRVGSVQLRINLPAALTAEQQERLLKVAHGCTVHQSLHVPPTVEIAVQQPVPS